MVVSVGFDKELKCTRLISPSNCGRLSSNEASPQQILSLYDTYFLTLPVNSLPTVSPILIPSVAVSMMLFAITLYEGSPSVT